MKPYIFCNIETLSLPGETAWVISIPGEAVSDAALRLSGLRYGKVNRLKFQDKSHIAMLSTGIHGYDLHLDGAQIPVTEVWVEAVLGMLLDVYLQGWSETAHLDQDFGNVGVTVAVLPPQG